MAVTLLVVCPNASKDPSLYVYPIMLSLLIFTQSFMYFANLVTKKTDAAISSLNVQEQSVREAKDKIFQESAI